jgi:hypothetical protein
VGARAVFKAIGFHAPLKENARNHVYGEHLKTFFADLNGKVPKSVDTCLTAVRVLLMENRVELTVLFWGRLKGRGA